MSESQAQIIKMTMCTAVGAAAAYTNETNVLSLWPKLNEQKKKRKKLVNEDRQNENYSFWLWICYAQKDSEKFCGSVEVTIALG